MRCFLIMPFSEEFDAVTRIVIEPTLKASGVEVFRADSFTNHRNILHDIIEGLVTADFIIADLTGLNPNVMYELGIAHGLKRPTVLMTQDIAALPFDLRSYRVIEYGVSIMQVEQFKTRLCQLAEEFINGSVALGSPVSDYFGEPILIQNNAQEKGFVDYLSAMEGQASDLANLFIQMTTAFEEFKDYAETIQADFNATKLSPAQRTKAIQKFSKQIAEQLSALGKQMDVETIGGSQYWGKLEENVNHLFITARKFGVGEEDLSNIVSLKETFTEIATNMNIFYSRMSDIRMEARMLRHISRDVGTAVRAFDSRIVQLMEFLSQAQPSIVRLNKLFTSLLEETQKVDDKLGFKQE